MTATTTNLATLSRRTNNASSSRIAPPTAFLALAPTTSSSYPAFRRSISYTSTFTSSSAPPAPLPPATLPSQIPLPPHDHVEEASLCELPDVPHRRRTSSVTSVASVASAKMRFLRLGPVHGGEEAGADYCEAE